MALVRATKRCSSSPTRGTLLSMTYEPMAGMPMMATSKTMAVTMDTSTREKPAWRPDRIVCDMKNPPA
ncbi:Uncharacterised protein [Bordetella pertussis]|nr:Uncharacterised protein [Bordetella pertussis]CFP63394.1 Uncharacterised protein [Bordetella pertussis]